MAASTNRQWTLARRPEGKVTDQDFSWAEAPLPSIGPGQVLVRTQMLSCDPTQRAWIAGDTYLPAVRIGEVMRSLGAGEVLDSQDPRFLPGDRVVGLLGWQDFACVTPTGSTSLTKLPPGVDLATALGILGMTSIAAYFGLLDVGQPKAGEMVVVSGAAGATGSVAAQIAKIKGCTVIGIAGGAEKCRWLRETVGLDAAIDYKSEDLAARLKTLCPNGIDVYFDNVGGTTLEIAISRLALNGRIVLCGAIAHYDQARPGPGPRNLSNLIVQRGRMQGFVVLDYVSRQQEALADLTIWLKEGRLHQRVDLQHGLENAPATLRRLFDGANQGKQLLRVA
jgi:NADPH-dependent curcumin reductase CurA